MLWPISPILCLNLVPRAWQQVIRESKSDIWGTCISLLCTYIKSLLLVLLEKKIKYVCTYLYRNIYIYFSKHQGKKNTDQETETILLQARGYYSSYELAHLFAPRLWKVFINSVDCNPLMTATISVLNALNLIRSQWIVCFSNYHTLRKSGIQAWPALRHSFIDPDSHPEGGEAPTDISESSLPVWEESVICLFKNKQSELNQREWWVFSISLWKKSELYSIPGKAVEPEWFSE